MSASCQCCPIPASDYSLLVFARLEHPAINCASAMTVQVNSLAGTLESPGDFTDLGSPVLLVAGNLHQKLQYSTTSSRAHAFSPFMRHASTQLCWRQRGLFTFIDEYFSLPELPAWCRFDRRPRAAIVDAIRPSDERVRIFRFGFPRNATPLMASCRLRPYRAVAWEVAALAP